MSYAAFWECVDEVLSIQGELTIGNPNEGEEPYREAIGRHLESV